MYFALQVSWFQRSGQAQGNIFCFFGPLFFSQFWKATRKQMLTHNLFESIVEQVIVLKESKPTSSALVLNSFNNTRPSSSSLRNTYDIMGGVGIWKGVRISCWIYFEYISIFQHDMKTFSDFPTRVAFREPSKCSLCLQVPSKTSAFLKICNFFSTKSNWIKYWQIGDTAVFVIKVLLTTKKVIV